MRTTDPDDAARIELLLAELRLPAIKQVWASLATQADQEGWPAGRFLVAVAEHEIAERSRRRLERHLAEARLPPGKDTFDFDAVPVISKAQGRRRRIVGQRRQFTVVRGHRVGARAISPQRLASLLSRTAGACCLPAPPISSSGCKLPAASRPGLDGGHLALHYLHAARNARRTDGHSAEGDSP